MSGPVTHSWYSHPGPRPKRFYRTSNPRVASVIRDLRFVGKIKQKDLGRMFGLTQGSVSRICSDQVWPDYEAVA